jgi:tetratricopeptide (TPR) repeat protein
MQRIVLFIGLGLGLFGFSWAGAVGAGKEDPKDEVRVKPGNLASDFFRSVMLSIALEADKKERAPRFEFKTIANGLRFTCNEIGNCHSLDIPGKKVARMTDYKGPGQAFVVDGRRLVVDSRPLRADAMLDIEKEFKLSMRDLEKQGWRLVQGSFQAWPLPDGEKAVYWEMIPKKDPKAPALFQNVITYNRRSLLMLIAPVRDGEDRKESAQLLRRTTLSLKRLPDLPSHKAALTVEYLEKNGWTLRQSLFVKEALMAKQFGALLNKELATPKDRRVQRTVLLEPKDLIQRVRLHLLLRQRDDDLASAAELRQAGINPKYVFGTILEMTVFDGATAHVVSLRLFDRKAGGYVYWEVWPDGTFLGKGNNRAGIAARRYPSAPRNFLITEAELAKVLYCVGDEWENLEADRIFLERFRKPKDQVVAEFKKLLPKNPKLMRYHEARLLAAGQCFLLDKQTKEASLAYQVCRTLHPDSVEALIGLADAQRSEGNKKAAAKLYRSALAELSVNKRLLSLKKERLQKHIEEQKP